MKKNFFYQNLIIRNNWNNINNTYTEIESLLSLNDATSHVPRAISLDGNINITNPCEIPKTFTKYCASIAETIDENTKYFQNSIFILSEVSKQKYNIYLITRPG